MSVRQVGAACGVSIASITGIENGSSWARLDTMQTIAGAVGQAFTVRGDQDAGRCAGRCDRRRTPGQPRRHYLRQRRPPGGSAAQHRRPATAHDLAFDDHGDRAELRARRCHRAHHSCPGLGRFVPHQPSPAHDASGLHLARESATAERCRTSCRRLEVAVCELKCAQLQAVAVHTATRVGFTTQIGSVAGVDSRPRTHE